MQSVGYWEAWRLWWDGESLNDKAMWFWSMRTWGRAGKLLQFAGGLIVVLDLIGPGRLTEFSHGLVEKSRLIRLRRNRQLVLLTRIVLIYSWSHFIIVFIFWDNAAAWERILVSAGTIGATFLTLSWMFPEIALLLARVLKAHSPNHPLRWLSFILVIFGFHLDLLAS